MVDKPRQTFTRLKRWRPGEKTLPARKLNGPIDAINSLVFGARVPQQPKAKGRHGVYKLTISSVDGDYVICTTPSGATVNVAKPYLLRRTPFDGTTSGRDGITFTYSSDSQREADDGTDTETQVVVPSYVSGDTIYAIRYPVGGTDVTTGGSPDESVTYLDINTDGRAWAKKAS